MNKIRKYAPKGNSLNLQTQKRRTLTRWNISLRSGLGVDPAGDGVTEEDEVGDDSARVQGDHVAHAAERRVLLLVVSDVPQRRAPGAAHRSGQVRSPTS